jgi:glycine/D-amino acid oxidase-like deaminating enzyme
VTARVVVVGAGVVGAAVAYHLARTGVAVQVVEREQPGAGATGNSYARLSAFDKDPHAYFRLNHEGMREHARLAGRLGAATWHHPCGAFIWADPDRADTLARRADQLRGWGYPLRWRDVDEINRELGAPLGVPAAVGQVLHAPDEGWVDAVALTRRLLTEAGRLGTLLRVGTQVVGLRQRDGAGWHVLLRGGEQIGTDVVVNVAGEAAGDIAAMAGSAVDLTPSRGLLLDLGAEGDPVRHILHSTQVSIRPDGPGRAVVRSDQIDQRLAGEPDPAGEGVLDELSRDLLRRAGLAFPALAGAAVLRRRIGWRVLPRGGYPGVGGVPGLPGYYEAVSHSGVILAPPIGRLLAGQHHRRGGRPARPVPRSACAAGLSAGGRIPGRRDVQ